MAPSPRPDEPLRWTVNCLVCHTAEIDGVAYFGAGTKTFDDLWLGEALKTLTSERWRSVLPGDSTDRALAAEANRILNSHHHDKIDSLTRARSTAFAASHVELFLRPNGAMPAVEDVGRGDMKTPPLWHTAAKMPSGRWYTDGSFHGPFPLMASSMELEKDRSFDALVKSVIPTIKAEFESVIRHLRPPPYPYAIDATLAARGKELFYSQEVGCARCHGVYDGRGNVDWPGVHKDVGTDRSRLDVVSDKFIAAFEQSPLAAEGALVKSQRIRRDTPHRRVGELSVPPQRERADAAPPARARVRAPGDLSRDGGRPLRPGTGRPGALSRSGQRSARARPSSCDGLATIATGST